MMHFQNYEVNLLYNRHVNIAQEFNHMIATPIAIDVPLWTDDDHVIRVHGTRITLYTLIKTYLLDESIQSLHEGYPDIALSDLYTLIGYYLAHRDEVDSYISNIENEADKRREDIESTQNMPTLSELKDRLDKRT